ncbi:MAG TPA: hypothetical protein VEC93_07410, partial [Anaerolineae bacterium]|nr:hypothetical protein [Anaerolineae bacterium]
MTKTIILVSGLAILLVGISTLMSYVRGLVPVVQGRFLLPALVPTAWLIGFSLWRLGVRWRSLMASLLLLLEIALGMSVLFFHSLPKFYAPRDTGFLGYWAQTIYLLFNPAGMFWDKPAFVNIWIFGLLILAFCGCAISVGILLLKQFGSPIRRDQLTTLLTLVNSAALVPTTSSVNKEGNNPASWTTHFRRAVRDPLLWTTCLLLIIYLGWVSFYPPNIFWSLDEGGKYIHLQSIIESGNPGAPLLYPGRYLDQKLNFVPLFFWARQDDQVYSWWPVGFQLITLPFYLLFGWFGLYLL